MMLGEGEERRMGGGGKEGGRRRKREGNEEANDSVCQPPYLKFIISLRERGGKGDSKKGWWQRLFPSKPRLLFYAWGEE